MKGITVLSLAAILGSGVIGCTTNELETRREATAAALSTYPGNPQQSSEFKLAAADDQSGKSVRILNLGDTIVPPGNLWVNGRYVAPVSAIPARSSIVVPYGSFLESGAGVMDLGKYEGDIIKVEIETSGGLYSIEGPSKT